MGHRIVWQSPVSNHDVLSTSCMVLAFSYCLWWVQTSIQVLSNIPQNCHGHALTNPAPLCECERPLLFLPCSHHHCFLHCAHYLLRQHLTRLCCHCQERHCVGWLLKRPAYLMKQFSLLEIMAVWLLLLVVATACSGSWSGNFKDTIVVDAHIFQHTPAEIGMESYLRTVLHILDRLNQLHS